jgi:hypothetical protein
VGLRLIFLTVSSVMSLFRLSRREEWWKDAEILMLRHQLAVALQERPHAPARLTWPDRAWLAVLAGMLPVDRLAEMWLIVTPGTILRWQRDIVRRRWAHRSRRGRLLAARLAGDTRLCFGGALCRWAAGGGIPGVVGSGGDSIVGVPDDSRAVRAGQPGGQASAAGLSGVHGGDVVRRLLPAEGPPGPGWCTSW